MALLNLILSSDAAKRNVMSEFNLSQLALPESELTRLLARPFVAVNPAIRKPGDLELARDTVAEQLAWLDAHRRFDMVLDESISDIDSLADEGLTWRVSKVVEAVQNSERIHGSDATDMGEDRAALSSHLQSLIDDRIWEKKR